MFRISSNNIFNKSVEPESKEQDDSIEAKESDDTRKDKNNANFISGIKFESTFGNDADSC